jgi:hypothetical protein
MSLPIFCNTTNFGEGQGTNMKSSVRLLALKHQTLLEWTVADLVGDLDILDNQYMRNAARVDVWLNGGMAPHI